MLFKIGSLKIKSIYHNIIETALVARPAADKFLYCFKARSTRTKQDKNIYEYL